MLVFPRISHHSLSWRFAHHRQTSYALLLFMVMVTALLTAGITWGTKAATSGSVQYTVQAVVPPARPTKPAIITSPVTGQSFNTNPVTVEGTCGAGSIVKIFTNGILVGSVMCGANGRFSIPIHLVIGKNDLTALPFNTLDQQGPTSPTVTVTLNQLPGGPGFSTEMLLQTPTYYRGTKPGEEIAWPVEIAGGQAPYAVSVDWGDGTSDLITRLTAGPFTLKHTYKKYGTGYLNTFPLIIRGTDAVGHTAYLQLTTIVNDSRGSATSGSSGNNGNNNGAGINSSSIKLVFIWPILIILILMIVSFWLGERREKHIMQRQLEALA